MALAALARKLVAALVEASSLALSSLLPLSSWQLAVPTSFASSLLSTSAACDSSSCLRLLS